MLEINLLPADLKPKPKKPGIDLESKETLYLIPLVFGIIIIIQLFLVGILMFKNVEMKLLSARWQKMETQRKALEEFRSQTAQLSEDARALQKVSSASVKWAPKLNKLSLDLPPGIWFRELSLKGGILSLKASVVSLEQSEIGMINQFLDNLKKDKDFFADFAKVDLGTIEKRTVGTYGVADFTVTGALKSQ